MTEPRLVPPPRPQRVIAAPTARPADIYSGMVNCWAGQGYVMIAIAPDGMAGLTVGMTLAELETHIENLKRCAEAARRTA